MVMLCLVGLWCRCGLGRANGRSLGSGPGACSPGDKAGTLAARVHAWVHGTFGALAPRGLLTLPVKTFLGVSEAGASKKSARVGPQLHSCPHEPAAVLLRLPLWV